MTKGRSLTVCGDDQRNYSGSNFLVTQPELLLRPARTMTPIGPTISEPGIEFPMQRKFVNTATCSRIVECRQKQRYES